MKIYAVRNKRVGAFELPNFSDSDQKSFAFQLQKQIILDPEGAAKVHLDECELYCLGDYDQEKGKLAPFADPEYLLDLGDIYERRIKEN